MAPLIWHYDYAFLWLYSRWQMGQLSAILTMAAHYGRSSWPHPDPHPNPNPNNPIPTQEELSSLIATHKVTLAFDAIAGDTTGTLL